MTEKMTLWLSYFDWLCDLIRLEEQTLYWKDILWLLLQREFVVTHPKDSNRVEDARDLRSEFIGLYRPPWAFYGFDDAPISVLEVLIALARRGEWEIMHDPDLGDRTSEWFWTMIFNLGLADYAYEGCLEDGKSLDVVENIVQIFLKRRYKDGSVGQIFLARSKNIDMRKEELWNQMCYFFDEYF